MKTKLKRFLIDAATIIGFALIIILSYPLTWYLTISRYIKGELSENKQS